VPFHRGTHHVREAALERVVADQQAVGQAVGEDVAHDVAGALRPLLIDSGSYRPLHDLALSTARLHARRTATSSNGGTATFIGNQKIVEVLVERMRVARPGSAR
jgi:hypothetical protein